MDVATEVQFDLADQCALNYILSAKKYSIVWKQLDYLYNYCTGTSFDGLYSMDGVKIRHYTGPDKSYELKYLKV